MIQLADERGDQLNPDRGVRADRGPPLPARMMMRRRRRRRRTNDAFHSANRPPT